MGQIFYNGPSFFFINLCFQEKQKKDEEDRKQRIQLYVFVLRSIAYPFNAKQPGDMTKRHLKVNKEGLEKLRAKVEVGNNQDYSPVSGFGLNGYYVKYCAVKLIKLCCQSFLKGETQIPSDEAFQIAVTNFAEIFLKSERVTGVVVGGGLSYHDCREIFRHQIEKVDKIQAFKRLVDKI